MEKEEIMSKQYTVTLTLPNGKRKYFRGKTRKEAEKKRDEAKLSIAMGVDIGNDMTVKELATIWLKEYKEGDVRDSSYLNLKWVIDCHIIPGIGNLKVREVRPVHIKHYMNGKEDLAKSTQRIILRVTKAIFNLAAENEIILRSPCVSSIKPKGEETKEKVPLTPEQADMLRSEAKGTAIYFFVLLGLVTGMRRGELLGLQWNDIDFDDGTISVQRTIAPTRENPRGELCYDLKTESARRTIPLPWSVVEELRTEMSGSKSVYIVHDAHGNHLTFSSLEYHWKKLTERLPFYVTPHLMRHTRVTRWFEQGLDIKEVQYLAGHADPEVTLGVYTHYQTEVRMQKTADKLRAIL